MLRLFTVMRGMRGALIFVFLPSRSDGSTRFFGDGCHLVATAVPKFIKVV